MNMGSVKTDLYQGHDYYMMDDLLTEEHKLIRDAARSWVKQEVSPIIEEAAETQVFPKHLLPGLGEIGAFGPYIPEQYGGAGLDQISYGLIMQELERCDSGLRSTASVQSSLVMYPIWKYGSEEQRMKYLPKLATGEMMGCFGLTEPDHGSNPGGMITNFKDAGDGENVILNGAKLWISNAPFADIAVVWAKDETGRIHGIVVERGMEGFSTPKMTGKWSLRASDTGELIFRRCQGAQGQYFAWPLGSRRSFELPRQCALWHCMGRHRCRLGLLRRGPSVCQAARAVRSSHCGFPIAAEEIG